MADSSGMLPSIKSQCLHASMCFLCLGLVKQAQDQKVWNQHPKPMHGLMPLYHYLYIIHVHDLMHCLSFMLC